MATSATERRARRNREIVDEHPRWRGIRHPELLVLPPRRYSRLDMLPAVERSRLQPAPEPNRRSRWEVRRDANAAIVAEHPRWRGIVHPERLEFLRPLDEHAARRLYQRAVARALARLRESERICAEIDAVVDRLPLAHVTKGAYDRPRGSCGREAAFDHGGGHGRAGRGDGSGTEVEPVEQSSARVRRRDEGRDHERRRLPERGRPDRRAVPVPERGRNIGRRDRSGSGRSR
jgi:hypothetical protein